MSSTLIATPLAPTGIPRVYKCKCDRPVFFTNSVCLACKTALGYEPNLASIFPLREGAEPSSWLLTGSSSTSLYRHCSNATSASACNWLTPWDSGVDGRCISCRLNRTIPNLSDASNGERWRKIEVAKRRLVSSLLMLGLPVIPRDEDPNVGLGFDFLRPDQEKVLTGHAGGIITLNIEEADDATREGIRERLHEPYRSLLGHLRHEVGHYYWDRLILDSPWIDRFRELFGDERADYNEALQLHYKQPKSDWQEHFVSAYASSHPWEDWAETWAHYLHVGDTLNTSSSFGMNIESVEMSFEGFTEDTLCQPDDDFLHFVNAWVRFTAVLNEICRSMGLPDFYPFVLTKSSIRKLHFVHLVVLNRHAGLECH
jgi:hypothetical protein